MAVSPMAKRPLVGSDRRPLTDAGPAGPANGDERLEVTVVVRRKDERGFSDLIAGLPARPSQHQHLHPSAFAAAFGADQADLDKVRAFAEAHGLAVVSSDAARRSVILSGSVRQFAAAFSVELHQYDYGGGTYRGRTGPVHVPEDLCEVVTAVLGLDNRPAARPHFRLRRPVAREGGASVRAAAPSQSYTPLQIAEAYGFPKGDGAGQCIAIIELGGGYKPADLLAYFAALGVPAPKVTAVAVDHVGNAPTGSANGPDGEVMLDIEVAGAIAPGAHIVVYFAPNTDAGFLNAITTAAHDKGNNPSIISISWGGPESSWTAQSLDAFDAAFQDAAVLGVSVFAASGDNGSADGLTDGAQHVDFPSSSPHVTGCGGTRLDAASGGRRESVWNDGAQGGAGGGGVSGRFPLPAWQSGLQVAKAGGEATPLSGRGVPDICADADPQTGYAIRVDGGDFVFGGTSAVAPLWAGLVALLNAASGRRLGFANPLLYANPGVLNDIVEGDNGAYSAAVGWDACTGLGSPNGAALAVLLGSPAPPGA